MPGGYCLPFFLLDQKETKNQERKIYNPFRLAAMANYST
jgi:hypothetical protein